MNTVIKPNLFIVGAMKSGTTTLHSYVGAHPRAFMSEPKEPGYFVPEIAYYPKDEDWYLSLFADAGAARVIGESSTHYAKLPVYQGVPARIAAYCDDPRMIYVMRDPVERTLSHYWHNTRFHKEARSMAGAFRDDVPYITFSDYAMQLEPWFDTFGRSRVLCLTFEELVRTPEDTVRRVYRWLGLDCAVPFVGERRENARPKSLTRPRGIGMLNRFANSGTWDKLAPIVPPVIKNLGRKIAYEDINPDGQAIDETILLLRKRMLPRVRAVEALLGRRFPQWTTTYGDDEAT